MDLRAYYKKVREIEAQLPSPYTVLFSLETPDGGKPGVLSEVVTLIAAKQIAEGRARAATAEETKLFHSRNHEAKQAADELAAASRMQIMVVPVKSSQKGPKE